MYNRYQNVTYRGRTGEGLSRNNLAEQVYSWTRGRGGNHGPSS